MDFRDTGRGADIEMTDVLEAELVREEKSDVAQKSAFMADAKVAPEKLVLSDVEGPVLSDVEGLVLSDVEVAATNNDVAYEKAESDSKTVDVRRFDVVTDTSRDVLLTEFGKDTLQDRYLLPGEGYQDLFARVASAYADDQEHAQRLYDYISKLWFMPATPILSNGGTGRGLPISCYLNSVDDSLEGIVNTWNENVWLASRCSRCR